jgi:RNA polymerase sigma-70 factor (ECF subfamily)
MDIPDDTLDHRSNVFREVDQAILLHIRRGDLYQALDMLVQTYQSMIVSHCAVLLADRERAEDMAQEVFLAAYTAMPKFRGEASMRTWLYRIAYNKCSKEVGKMKRRTALRWAFQKKIASFVHINLSDEPDETEACEEKRRCRGCIREALSRLRGQDRLVLSAYYRANLDIEEVAASLGVSPKTIRRYIKKAAPEFKRAYVRCMQRES